MTSDLAFHTTEELVTELIRRKTFLGVVIHSAHELKMGSWRGGQVFRVHSNSNLDMAEVARLLHAISEHVDQQQS